jgi:hypothetical protein
MLTAILLLQQVSSLGPSHGSPSVAFVAPTVTTVRVAQGPISLDGRLGEPGWTLTDPVTDLRQVDPNEGAVVSESTEVRILYDGEALYVGARLFDREPAKIIRRLTRRDASTHSDEFTVYIDSYHDHLTAFRFTVNPAGVKGDELEGGDGEFGDKSWDPVWEAATTVDSLGWTVEMRIPFTQLRFSGASEQMWGVRFEREIRRKNEVALFPSSRRLTEDSPLDSVTWWGWSSWGHHGGSRCCRTGSRAARTISPSTRTIPSTTRPRTSRPQGWT